jgi:hypothetical protein
MWQLRPGEEVIMSLIGPTGIHGRRPGRRLSGVDLPRRHSIARAGRDPLQSPDMLYTNL